MSIEAMVSVLNIGPNPDLGASERLLLIVLANYANETKECWPSYDTLADKCGVSRRTIIRTMVRLIALGAVARKPRRTPYGNAASNVYELMIGSDAHATRGSDAHATRVVTPTPPNPSVDPSVDPKKGREGVEKRQIPPVVAKTTTTDPRIKSFIEWFQAEYQRQQNTKYILQGEKDNALVKTLLEQMGVNGADPLEGMKRAAKAMLDDEEWGKAHADFRTLASQINHWYQLANANRPEPQRDLTIAELYAKGGPGRHSP